ncbi:MAG: hypothetical protein DCC67_06805 [Planctomycetota bacterium]|nr:MAG: hypothetical protein DCC67_06805 [Planctomycetota bacterium]
MAVHWLAWQRARMPAAPMSAPSVCSRRRARGKRLVALCSVLAWSLAGAAGAIDIVIHLGDEGENPSYDSDGAKLAAIFNAAASFWEDYLPEAGETGTYDVDVFWSSSEFEDEDDPALARWSFQAGGNNNIRVNPNPESGGDAKQWYIDVSPFDHSEYDFFTQIRDFDGTAYDYQGGQWLFRDVSAAEQMDWFTGNPPGPLEIGYRGRTSDPVLVDQYDLLSTVIHELGVNDTGGPWSANSIWLRSGSAILEEDVDGGHLRARTSLMCEGCGMLGTRRLPSAVDIMAVADDEAMGAFDLPRRDYVGDGHWGHPLLFVTHGWIGGLPPDASDDAFLRSDNQVTLNVNAEAKSLRVEQSSDLNTGGFTVAVAEQTTIGGGVNGGALQIGSGGKLTTADLWVAGLLSADSGGTIEVASKTYIPQGGHLLLNGAVAQVGQVFIQDLLDPFLTGGLLSGRGTIDAAGILVNDGKIAASGGTLLFVSTSNSALWNLDGSGAGLLEAIAGDLTFLGPTLTFDSIATVGIDRTLTVNETWKLGAAGRLNLIGAVGAPATLHGHAGAGHAVIAGRVTVDVLGVIDIAVTFEPSAVINVADNNDRLQLLQSITYRGGVFNGDGVIEQVGSADVGSDTTLDVRVYDWDGAEGDPATTSIDPEVVLTLNSQVIEQNSNDGHDGAINVNGGILEVNTKVRLEGGFAPAPWRLDRTGRLNLKNGALVPDGPTDGSGAIVRGSPLIVEGTVRALGAENRIEALATFIAGASVVVEDRNSELFLGGATTFFGGSYTGAGVLHQEGHASIQGNTQSDVATYNWDGPEEAPSNTAIAAGVELTLNVGALETQAADGYDGTITLAAGGRLNVNTPDPWRLDGELRLDGATVVGSPIENYGAIKGAGVISAAVANHGTVAPGLSAGLLLINAPLVQHPAGTIAVEVGGSAIGQFDVMMVAGDAALDGTLEVSLLGGYEPPLGQKFTILAASSGDVLGSFATLVRPYFNGRTFEPIYNATSVELEVTPGYEADFDEDGDVDGDDLANWKAGFGSPGSAVHMDGDADGDADVDGADFLVWQQQLGSSSADLVLEPVPEAAAAALAGGLFTCVAIARRAAYKRFGRFTGGQPAAASPLLSRLGRRDGLA